MNPDPLRQFEQWYEDAKRNPAIADPSAMALATADDAGRPSVRMVLLKQRDEHGFVFFTNLESPKARDLATNPQAALCFHWAPLGRQVRIEGSVVPVEDTEADEYFETRPRLSQLGAWASQQSKPMPHRLALETGVAWAAACYGVGKVPRPPHWSGFRVSAERYEFWSEGPFRQHERMVFEKAADGWKELRLFP